MIVGVIGSGSIGPDLAYGFVSAIAREGGRVYLHDIKQEALDAGMARIGTYVTKALARGKLSESAARAVKEALVPTLSLADLAACDYVLEAATEDLPIKRKIIAALEATVRPDCLIGFATSGIPRAEIAKGTKHPERCFVNHPFYPAWRALPVEVVLSGDDTFGERMIRTLEKLGKVPIITADVACFAADDIFCNYVSEAARIVAEGVATPAQVDAIVNDAIGGGGPLNVMDLTRGNLLTVHCQELMRDAPTGSAWFEPPAILREVGNRPWHDPKNRGDGRYDAALGKTVLDRILAVLFARTYFVADENICAPSDLDWLTRMSLGFRKGLLSLAEEFGIERVHAVCTTYAAAHPGFHVPKSITEKNLPRFRKNVVVTRDGDLALVSVRRPEVRNALNRETLSEIEASMKELAADDTVKGVIFTSQDGALAGADIGELASLKTPADCEAICHFGHAVLDTIASMKKPVVAALNGPVLGGGAEISMACHGRVVGPELVLGQPEVNLGIIPGYGGTQRLPRLIGFERALDLLRTGRSVGAKEAHAWGWATIAPVKDFLGEAKALVQKHLAGEIKLAPVDAAPIAVPEKLPATDLGHHSRAIDAILVSVVRRGNALPLAEGLALEAKGFGQCKETVDLDIGMKNFIQNGPRVPAAFLHE
ncbi:3-hydroxyacyl-CoA dehydrogenase/enoyl-CoA hydratase family protein [Polyangium sorediatum]|uniref:Enoyl-CoA hydratase-related protein n=1 Tax=Polyangium sorediatum TaxID=889274 RepID=A0ABT6NNH2_9BACT|nr:3-hydroxyacyl-CoA dehydrogenase/enoyl-CoA hydratase family protein [Polyangium sorediatum]MDI1429740.1 enoyl-CoA hydratase-related protein [Polyangium sorediatum]